MKIEKINKSFLLFTLLLLLLQGNALSQQSYYVNLSGSDTNTGFSDSTAWRTITFAASSGSPVSPGDTVFIKAGDYGSEQVVFETSGNDSMPIVFEGYQSVPGDKPSLNWTYGDSLDAHVMPLLNGASRDTGTGITMHSREYIHLSNIQIRNYRKGLYAWNADNNQVDNVLCMYFGDPNASYDGTGIKFGSQGNNNILSNCLVYNACAEGISIVGDGNFVYGCRVYADDNSTGVKSSMDYYIHINGDSNIIDSCYAERVGGLDHSGHGIEVKGNGENNIIRNCTARGFKRSGFSVRRHGAKNNTFENCTAINCGYGVRDGASNNRFVNCLADSADYGIVFFDAINDSIEYTGRHNVFENCIFQNTRYYSIDFFYWKYPSSSVCDSNTFVNCLFEGGDYLFNIDRRNQANKMVNCIVINVDSYYTRNQYPDSSYSLNFDFSHTNFWNNGFAPPAGDTIYNFDPGFVNAPNKDFHLTAASPCIDTGTAANAPAIDFDGISRPQGPGIDLGPFEYDILTNVSSENLNFERQGKVKAYPNPSDGVVIVEAEETELNSIQVFDKLGKNLTSMIRVNGSANYLKLDFSNVGPGIYIIKAMSSTTMVLIL